MRTNFLLMTLGAVAVLTSCTKEKTPKTAVPEPATNFVAAAYVGNSNNPYDYVGARHNSALDSLLKQNFRANLNRDELFRKNFDFFQREFPAHTYNQFYVPLKGLFDSLHNTDVIATPLERRGMKPAATAYINRMIAAINAASSDVDFARNVMVMENEAKATFLGGSVRDSISAAQVLSAASVFRYSAHYWYQNGSAWKKSMKLANPGADTTSTWGGVAKEDAKGAVAGAVGGSLAGPSGAVTGGFLGGIGSSLASWLFD